jgi:hypothetical protein
MLLIFGSSDQFTDAYSHFPEDLRLEMLKETREMFIFGYDSYMKYAFPLDELDPIHCTGKLIAKCVRDCVTFLPGHLQISGI